MPGFFVERFSGAVTAAKFAARRASHIVGKTCTLDDDVFELNAPGEPLTPLERLDHLIAALPPGDVVRGVLPELRLEFAEQEDMVGEARETIEKMAAIIKKVTSPANRIGTFLGTANRETAQIGVGGADYLLQCRSARQHRRAAARHARAGQ